MKTRLRIVTISFLVKGLTTSLVVAGLVGCRPTSPPTTVPETVSTRTCAKDGMVQVYVPAGEFLMGSTSSDIDQVLEICAHCQRDWFQNEMPQRQVYLDAFWIDRTEVTNAMFAEFVAATGYETAAEQAGSGIVFNLFSKDWKLTKGADWQHPRGPTTDIQGLDDHPVVQVNWNDATAYCEWAGRRLPTEAEWEKAARGTDGRVYPWGNQPPAGNLLNFADRNLDAPVSNHGEDDGYPFTAPVGSYPDGASPYGALDMAGNVWERVSDWYGDYASAPSRNPAGPSSGDYVILRGGSWSRAAWHVRTAFRLRYPRENRSSGQGFRCASSP
jgi:formylglycine-generating enzyme required for sulfatase activity